jgi:hypothetical protein
MRDVIVTPCKQGFKAYFGHDPSKWEMGDSIPEAVGKMVIAHGQADMGTKVVMCTDPFADWRIQSSTSFNLSLSFMTVPGQ